MCQLPEAEIICAPSLGNNSWCMECVSVFMCVDGGLISYSEEQCLSLAHHLHVNGDIRWTDIIQRPALQHHLKVNCSDIIEIRG